MVEKSAALVAVRISMQLEPREEECDDDGGEYFKEPFNPEVNYPPAPVFGGDQMAALAVHQAGRIEERDGNAGDEEERKQSTVLALANQRRLERRTIRTSQSTSPMNSRICQKRPRSTYSKPWLPNQNHRLPSRC